MRKVRFQNKVNGIVETMPKEEYYRMISKQFLRNAFVIIEEFDEPVRVIKTPAEAIPGGEALEVIEPVEVQEETEAQEETPQPKKRKKQTSNKNGN